jgi:hypothetical protein
MTTTLPDPVQDRATQVPSPSPWSAPRPDGPLAAALRYAHEHRAQPQALAPHEALSDIPMEMLPDLQPLEAAPPVSPEVMAHDIEELAREARARDDLREALAVALDWPQEVQEAPRRVPPWWGWAALAGTVVAAGAAATVAVSMSSMEDPSAAQAPLKLEKRLSLPP